MVPESKTADPLLVTATRPTKPRGYGPHDPAHQIIGPRPPRLQGADDDLPEVFTRKRNQVRHLR